MVLPAPLPARWGGAKQPIGILSGRQLAASFMPTIAILMVACHAHPMSHQVALRKPKYADLRTFR